MTLLALDSSSWCWSLLSAPLWSGRNERAKSLCKLTRTRETMEIQCIKCNGKMTEGQIFPELWKDDHTKTSVFSKTVISGYRCSICGVIDLFQMGDCTRNDEKNSPWLCNRCNSKNVVPGKMGFGSTWEDGRQKVNVKRFKALSPEKGSRCLDCGHIQLYHLSGNNSRMDASRFECNCEDFLKGQLLRVRWENTRKKIQFSRFMNLFSYPAIFGERCKDCGKIFLYWSESINVFKSK